MTQQEETITISKKEFDSMIYELGYWYDINYDNIEEDETHLTNFLHIESMLERFKLPTMTGFKDTKKGTEYIKEKLEKINI